ncbi:MAG: hypothetical protein ACREB6_06250 [Rhodospirillales bacterium]
MDVEKAREALRRSFDGYNMAGYSEAPSGRGHLLGDGFYYGANVLRNIDQPSSQTGLFKENRDVYFWWFGRDGAVVHENKTHFNNVGLVSRNDHSPTRSADEFRIAVLGDEMTGATTADVSWPDFLEEFLNAAPAANRKYRVFNFGHLDTGVHEWRRIWDERARKFDVDLVIVNLADHTFNRIGEVYTHISHWDSLPGFKYVFYELPGQRKAVTWIRCIGNASTLRDPDCYTSKLLTFWLEPDMARDKRAMARLRDMVIADYVDGADFGKCRDALNPRDHAHPDIPQYTEAERIASVCEHLARIADSAPDALFLMNPWLPHFQDYSLIDHNRFRNLELLSAMNGGIKIVDMRRSYRLWGRGDVSALYSPYAAEKWTDLGHRIYGQAVGDLVLEHLSGFGPAIPVGLGD